MSSLPLCQTVPSPRQTTPTAAHQLLLVPVEDPERGSLQAFIQQGFAEHYQALIPDFMPQLLGVRSADGWLAALGIRFAASARLFTEGYLQSPAEQVLQQNGISTRREEIAEIGHLLAVNRQALMQLFVLMAQSLHQLGLTRLLFSATRDVQLLLKRHGIELTDLGAADPACLGEHASLWGSYYQTQPRVCSLSLAQVAQRLGQDAKLQALIHQHWPDLHHLVAELQEVRP
ncbi:thermostable hemolysin [Rheinheimera sp.]|uniref:thermostable hemolysin n=1 Tax=Rheinheimera sp. TaxID=1869214 RepID=UPI00307CE56C